MKLKHLFLTALALISLHSYSQEEEASIDFRVDSAALERGEDQMSFEWQSVDQFRSTQVAVTDLVKVNLLQPENIQMVNAKVAMLSAKPFSYFVLKNLATVEMVQNLLESQAVSVKGANAFAVTNKVKAYGLPFKVNFDLLMKEIAPDTAVKNYFKSQGAAFEGTGKEVFLSLDMTNFSQLIYRNYSVIYAKELKNGKTLLIATVICGINIDKANTYFNYPPISRTDRRMVGNIRTQTLHMMKQMKN